MPVCCFGWACRPNATYLALRSTSRFINSRILQGAVVIAEGERMRRSHLYARRAGDRAALEHGAIHLTVIVIALK